MRRNETVVLTRTPWKETHVRADVELREGLLARPVGDRDEDGRHGCDSGAVRRARQAIETGLSLPLCTSRGARLSLSSVVLVAAWRAVSLASVFDDSLWRKKTDVCGSPLGLPTPRLF
jgi:hypothetical protein